MADAQLLLSDIIDKISTLREELDNIRESEHRRQRTETALTRRHQIITLLNSIQANLAAQQAREDLYESICRLYVESGLVHAAWIGIVDAEAKTARPVMSARIDEEHLGISLTVPVPPEGAVLKGPVIETICSGEVFVSNQVTTDPRLELFRHAARKFHYNSLGAFPVKENGDVRLVLLLFAGEENLFSDEVVREFQKTCETLSVNLRRISRELDFRHEMERMQSELAKYRLIADEHVVGIAIIQNGIVKYANNAFADICGYSPEEIYKWEPNEFTKIIHPDDVTAVTDPERRRGHERDGITYYSYRIIRKDGTERQIHRYSKTIFYQGEHAHLIAMIDASLQPVATLGHRPMGDPEIARLALYQQLFESNPYAILLIDYDSFEILSSNDAAVSQYGYSGDEFSKMSVRDLYPPDELSEFLESFTRLPLTGSLEITTKHKKRDGTIIDVEIAARHIRLVDRTAVLMVVRDITNSKWAEEVLRESEANYRNVFNAIGYEVLVFDRDARILELNSAACRTFQVHREETIGRDFDIINATENNSRDQFLNHLLLTFDTGESKINWWFLRKDGTPFLAETILRRGVYFGRDAVVASVRVKDTGSESPHVLSTALTTIPTALAIMDSEGRLTWSNPAFSALVGYGVDELALFDLYKLVAEEHNGGVYEQMWETIRRGDVWYDEIKIKTGDGKTKEIAFSVTPMRTDGEPIPRYIITAKNVTEEKHRMQEMLQKQKMDSIDTISRAIAHDFNNILGIILGYASFLEKRKDDPAKFHSDIEEIKNAVQRGANLIKQMLAYTHRNDVSYESINPNEVIQEVVTMLQETFPATIALSVELEEGIPSIQMGRSQLHQIVTELCVNARDAIEDPNAPQPGHGRIMVQTKKTPGSQLREIYPSAQSETYVEIRVSDTGVGMDEETKNKVFDPFFSAKEFGKGKGLGLTAVYGIVKSYKGFILVESEPNRGSSFSVFLPVANGSAVEDRELLKETETERLVERKKILAVEDEPSLLGLLKQLLEESGYSVITARDGIEGVKMYEKHKDEIGLVISDVGLPKLDGFNAFLQMRRLNPDVKAILASGYLDDKVKDDLYKEGVKDFIRKPYHTEEILTKVREILHSTSANHS